MNIAVFLEQKLDVGGGFQQSLSVLLLMQKYNKGKHNFIVFTTFKENINVVSEYGIKSYYLNLSRIKKFLLVIRRFLILNNIIYFKNNNFIEKLLNNKKVDVCYFLGPSKIPFYLENYNFILTVWDLSHRDMPEFPEVRQNYQFEKREFIYQNLLKKAVAIISDSKIGKKNIIRRYKIDEKRIFIARFLPSKQIEIKNELIDINKIYAIEGKYIFYPAQFWAHKNHIYILDALKILKDKYNKKITAVFSGSNKGNLDYVLNYAVKLGIKNQVKYVGFVPSEYFAKLYSNSIALVMPTYFGPTNIPPLEAFKLKVPVFYSDLPEFRDDLGEAVFYIDLNNPEDLAEKLYLLLNNKLNVKDKIALGEKFLNRWTEIDYWKVLDKIFSDFEIKYKSWHH